MISRCYVRPMTKTFHLMLLALWFISGKRLRGTFVSSSMYPNTIFGQWAFGLRVFCYRMQFTYYIDKFYVYISGRKQTTVTNNGMYSKRLKHLNSYGNRRFFSFFIYFCIPISADRAATTYGNDQMKSKLKTSNEKSSSLRKCFFYANSNELQINWIRKMMNKH